MMIEEMANLDFNGKAVLDFGCDTGILSTLAVKLGAGGVTANNIKKYLSKTQLKTWH